MNLVINYFNLNNVPFHKIRYKNRKTHQSNEDSVISPGFSANGGISQCGVVLARDSVVLAYIL